MYETRCRCADNEAWNSITLHCEECGEEIPLEFALKQIDFKNRGDKQ